MPRSAGRQRRCIVHAVAGHGYVSTFRARVANPVNLVLGQQARVPIVDAHCLSQPLRLLLPVAGEHHNLPDAKCMEMLDSLRRCGPHGIRELHPAAEFFLHCYQQQAAITRCSLLRRYTRHVVRVE